ncbi:recombination protein NinB [Thalassobius sp. S69A]
MGLNGEPFPVGFRSSAMTVSQMSDLIEFISAWAAQHGVVFTERGF